MKICTKCRVEQSLECFSWRNKAKGTRSSVCKTCHSESRRKHFVSNRGKIVGQIKARRQNLIDSIWKYKNENSCVDCGFSDPRALQFDHLPEFEKEFDISRGPEYGFSWEKILSEIAKCEVVCANCHAIRTHDGGEWVRNIIVEI